MNKAFQIFIRLIFLIVSNSLNASEDLTLNTTENPIFERIWKFEINRKDYFNTVQAKPKEFEGLLLCTDSGVLNTGNGSIEVQGHSMAAYLIHVANITKMI